MKFDSKDNQERTIEKGQERANNDIIERIIPLST
jgi:hypothetical protein